MTSRLIFIAVLLAEISVFSFSVEAANNDETMEKKEQSSETASGKEAGAIKQLGSLVENVANSSTEVTEHAVTVTTDTLQSTTDELTETVEKTSSHTSQSLKESNASVTKAIHSTTEEITKVPILEPVAKTVQPTVKSTLDTTSKVVEDTADIVENTVNTAAYAANETVKETGKLARKTSEEAGNTLQTTVKETVRIAEEITKTTQKTIEPATQKPPVISGPSQERETPAVSEKDQQKVEMPASPERLIEEKVSQGLNKQIQAVEQISVPKLPTVSKLAPVQKENNAYSSAKAAALVKHKVMDSRPYGQLTSLQAVPIKRVNHSYNEKMNSSSSIESFDSSKQTEERTVLKKWTTIYTVPAPSQTQQSAPVMQGNQLFSGVAALLGSMILIAPLLRGRWLRQMECIRNQWVHAPPGQPPKFSPFLFI